ncbi:MAG TPA: hypothetical protein PLJ60_05875 [Chryseolinea sp.]|nr:hypothetical protein [Chryseolinea sp.]HPM29847.1 hypothetical protein [Chryseolinea sp.]
MLKVIRSLTPEAKIKVLEYLSMACIIPMLCFMAFGNLTNLIIKVSGCVGLIFQVPIFLLYKSLNQQDVYIKNKAGALAIAGLLMLSLVFMHNS